MRLTLHTFVTLDGVMQGPGGPEEDPGNGFDQGGWAVPYAGPEFDEVVDGWFTSAEAFLLGRSTYEMFFGYWARVTGSGQPGRGKAERAAQVRRLADVARTRVAADERARVS